MNSNIAKLLIKSHVSIKEALKQMDVAGEKILFVVNERNGLLGSVSDGDIRRWILKEGSLQEKVAQIYNGHPKATQKSYSLASIRETMIASKIEALPVVDHDNIITDVLLWNDVFSSEARPRVADLDVPVLIMAGGKGTRLDPFTKILPKPLIPIGDKPIVELIMDQFSEFGCKEFYLTLNYKGKMIQSYFDYADCKYDIKFIWEESFLGTAGSLRLAVPTINARHIFVSNCDILIKADYANIYEFHVNNNYDVTVIGSMQHVSVPFGVLEVKNGGHLENIVEKPEYDFLANTGMYLVKKGVAEIVPPNTKFDFTELLIKVKEAGGRVGVYPVSQQSWIDIGQWQEYQSALKKLEPK